MKILVTGATGFLGAHVVRCLLHDGHQVRILRRKTSSTIDLDGLIFETAIGDICDANALSSALQGVDAVIHAAALISYWEPERDEVYRVNAEGTRCIADAALSAGVKRFVHVSTVMAVGVPVSGMRANETQSYNFDRVGCDTIYSRSKYLAEDHIQSAVARGLPAVIVNPGAIIGPMDRRRIVGGLFFPGKLNQYFYISGGMSAVDVEDVASGIVRALNVGRVGERYLLTGEDVSYREMRAVIAEEMGTPRPCIRIPSFVLKFASVLGEVVSRITQKRPRIPLPMARMLAHELYFSSHKAQSELGWSYRPYRESVCRALAWHASV
ncbi:MAG: NAD-dependent dehydratase [Deltaproteobacteria bacterium CG11_big_fil_rev_8_21_14_0_20_47_16]|nr:MAG: NAD-dependent dehydratase [Deltaproteobacteria bacterium CG11_big_fil_rev_8_21_14_0_20_47_16]